MATFGFVFTLAVVVFLAFVSALSFSAYIVSRRRTLLYLPVLCLGYVAEQCIILFHEYQCSNLPFDASSFSGMEDQFVRIVLGGIMCGALMIAVIEHYDREEKLLRWLPSVVFVVVCTVVCLIPSLDAAFKKWTVYTARQVFLAFIACYCLLRYVRIPNGPVKARYMRRRMQFGTVVLLALLTAVEDTYVMLFMNVNETNLALAELLYRRNMSETILVIVGACFLAYVSTRILRSFAKPDKKPSTKDVDKEQALAFFADKYGLTQREQEVLSLVVENYDNQQIANELQLALGTVKTHVHHLFRKSKSSSREELIKKFWINS